MADASVILPVFSQYARTFLRKSNEYAINTLYHKCTVFVSFNYRRIMISQSGSIAEASMKLTNIFEEAQKAADLYLYNVKNKIGDVHE
ncbi:hypothetical protein HCC05_08530 [Streptococcus suis]|nr:hypothetical protein [Streptococcus suis]ASW52843.1 hypothetical protein A7J09_03465 [Streptococcus suis]KPA63511.1 hypothetical protein XK26_09315 [Streptococcus suis]MCK3908992.1 hypothetical protein [Streptococcus suis]MCK3931503.1 hypothetical protein [Streptococcus suis]MCK3934250.1 hypothetical protein [Streptococcus suis]